jgi:hypothetical protein
MVGFARSGVLFIGLVIPRKERRQEKKEGSCSTTRGGCSMMIRKLINRVIDSEHLDKLENWVISGRANTAYIEKKGQIKAKCTELAGKLKKFNKLKDFRDVKIEK